MSNRSPGEKAGQTEDELLGRVFDDRFRIEEVIGEGGMGRVYRGHQLSVERDVAIKVLHGELSLDEELKKRFFREAKVVSDFNHPNIVRLIDFGTESELGLLYLVMELIDGVELSQVLTHGRLRPELALRIAYQAAGALVEAHSAGVIHRDLKAENLLLVSVADGTLQAKIVDFGIAYPQKASEKLTRTGRIYGTASYMAPEQARGKDVDARADLFSLGVLMFEMLTGQLPIEGTNSIEVMIKQVREGPPPLSDILPEDQFPTDVFELVNELLAGTPDQRPDDAREVRERLETIFRQQAWEPVRIDASKSGLERFQKWMLPPVELSEQQAMSRGETQDALDTDDPTPKAGAMDVLAGENGNETTSASEEQPSLGPDGPPSDEGGRRTLLIAAVLLGGALLVLVPVVVYVGFALFRPDAGSPFEFILASNQEKTEESDTNGTSGAKGGDDEGGEDPVCGEINRSKLPERWRGEYAAQGGDDEVNLTVRSGKLHVRWSDGGATIWPAQASDSDGVYSIDCARFSGSGDGNECSGTVQRRGPVLVVKLDGTEVCRERFSGTWMSK